MKTHSPILILGAPNVGKSTLFNRLLGYRKSVVIHEPGVTRDLVYGSFKMKDQTWTVIDSGGFLPDVKVPISRAVQKKIVQVIEDCSLILFLVDVRRGITPLDEEIAIFLKKRARQVILCVNKVDSFSLMEEVPAFYALGFDEPIPISSEHGLGISVLIEKIEEKLLTSSLEKDIKESEQEIKVIIMGKQNVGKSSLLNAMSNSDRMIVTDMPGTTIDSVDTLFEREGNRYRIIDTAGLRRKKRKRGEIEKRAIMKAKQNLKKADVAILVLDSQEGITTQDVAIAGYINRFYKPLLIAFNKWDLIEVKRQAALFLRQEIKEKFKFLKSPPFIFLSALQRRNIHKIFPIIDSLYEKHSRRIRTSELNQALSIMGKDPDFLPSHPSRFRVKYITQIGIRPQKFLLFIRNGKRVSPSTRRFLENSLRNYFQLNGVPIKLLFRESRRVLLKQDNK